MDTDERMPRLSPAYDFVSTLRYIADGRFALSIAKEKAANQLNVDYLNASRGRPRCLRNSFLIPHGKQQTG